MRTTTNLKVRFTKMHGAGNDFIVVDATREPISLSPQQWRQLADRRFGVGADQVLIVGPAADPDIDFSYQIFNSDGGEVEQCGNGARAFAKFVVDKGLTDKRSIRVKTLSGVIEPQLEDDGQVTVDMGPPHLDPADVPFDTRGLVPRREGNELLWPLQLAVDCPELAVLSMGNPHAVQVVPDIERAPVSLDGPQIEGHQRFAQRVNAGFMQVIDSHEIRLRVWERGAGETLACGTGACAAVVSGIRRGLLVSPVTVHTRGGTLVISWKDGGQPVYMKGPATTVYEGEIELDSLS
jgi:diaminopimelate epimerase